MQCLESMCANYSRQQCYMLYRAFRNHTVSKPPLHTGLVSFNAHAPNTSRSRPAVNTTCRETTPRAVV